MKRSFISASLVLIMFCVICTAANKIVFKKVDVFVTEGGDEKKRDARLKLFPGERILALVDEKNGAESATYVRVPYDNVTKIVYERSSHRRYEGSVPCCRSCFHQRKERLVDNRVLGCS